MKEAEIPQRTGWLRRNAILLSFAVITGSILCYLAFFGFRPAGDLLHTSAALVSGALHDTLGSGNRAHLAAEIDLASRKGQASVPGRGALGDRGANNTLPRAASSDLPRVKKISEASGEVAPFARPDGVPLANTAPVLPPSVPRNASPGHIVIAAVQISGASSTDDFIKIFNPTGAAVDISGWRLRKRARSGTEYSIRVFAKGSTVQPQGSFLWANAMNSFAANIGADVSSTATLAADNSVALENASGTIIDALAWGSGHTNPFVEGAAYPTNPDANRILSRKFVNNVIQDTDVNAQDFSIL